MGTAILKLPTGGSARLRLVFDAKASASKQPAAEQPFDGTVVTKSYRAVHDAAKMGGLPYRFEFVESQIEAARREWQAQQGPARQQT